MLKSNLMLVASLVLTCIFESSVKGTKTRRIYYKCGRQRNPLDKESHDSINERRPGSYTGVKTSICRCGTTTSTEADDFIIAGKPVKDPSKYPFMITLNEFITNTKEEFCGGAIISPTFVMTAGHCLKKGYVSPSCKKKMESHCYMSSKDFRIGVFTQNSTKKPSVFVEIDKIIPHPKYNIFDTLDDIALLKLKKPLECTKYTRPICINEKVSVGLGQVIHIAGYGSVHTDKLKVGSDVLRNGVMVTAEQNYCLSKNSFGAVGNEQSSCFGDSGSVSFLNKKNRYFAVGVTSVVLGKKPCVLGSFACFTNITKHYSFIKENVKDLPNL